MADAGRYMTHDELEAVMETVKFLNENVGKQEVRFKTRVIDSNGDDLGRIDFSESGYVFYLE